MSEAPEHFLHDCGEGRYPSKQIEERLESGHRFHGTLRDVGLELSQEGQWQTALPDSSRVCLQVNPAEEHTYAGHVKPGQVLPKEVLETMQTPSAVETTHFKITHSPKGRIMVIDIPEGFIVVLLDHVAGVTWHAGSVLREHECSLRVEYHDSHVHVTTNLSKEIVENLTALIKTYVLAE